MGCFLFLAIISLFLRTFHISSLIFSYGFCLVSRRWFSKGRRDYSPSRKKNFGSFDHTLSLDNFFQCLSMCTFLSTTGQKGFKYNSMWCDKKDSDWMNTSLAKYKKGDIHGSFWYFATRILHETISLKAILGREESNIHCESVEFLLMVLISEKSSRERVSSLEPPSRSTDWCELKMLWAAETVKVLESFSIGGELPSTKWDDICSVDVKI